LRPGQYVLSVKTDGFAASSSQVDISEFIPRQYVILQLQPVGETFRHRESAAGIVDARVPQSARLEFDKGRIALQEKRAEEAVRHLEKAIEIYRDFFEAQSMLGDAHMELRQWQKAEGALRRALEIRPKTPDTLISLGEVYRREKKYKEAEKSLVESLKLERASWRGHFTLGRVYWETDEVLKAAPHVGQAIELKPDYPEARILAGNIFMRLNMPQNALVEYEEYLRLAPGGEFAAQTRENVEKLRKALPKK
jgi:tetratricopeptide (TPR) repeat protein